MGTMAFMLSSPLQIHTDESGICHELVISERFCNKISQQLTKPAVMVGDLIQSSINSMVKLEINLHIFTACAQFSSFLFIFLGNFMIVLPVFSHFWSGLVGSAFHPIPFAFIYIVEGSNVCGLKFLHLLICNENTCKGLCIRVYSSIHNNGFNQSEALKLLAFIVCLSLLLLFYAKILGCFLYGFL